jgi:hypothetical protein
VAFGARRASEEEVKGLACPLGDQLQRLLRRLGFARLDEVDRGSAYVAAGDLAKAETGALTRLLDRPRTDLDTAAATAPTRDESVSHRRLRHLSVSLTQAHLT